jgi:RNA polymerase sigma factor (sigma-70 family)
MMLTAIGQSSAQYALRDPDIRLMLRVRADEAGAFEQLVLLFQQRLVVIMKPMVGSREEAEDLAQEAFLRVYKSRKNYHPKAKFSTWLFTIANNLALNSIRSKKRRPQVSYLTSESVQHLQVGIWNVLTEELLEMHKVFLFITHLMCQIIRQVYFLHALMGQQEQKYVQMAVLQTTRQTTSTCQTAEKKQTLPLPSHILMLFALSLFRRLITLTRTWKKMAV